MAQDVWTDQPGAVVANAVAVPVLEYGRGWMAAPATAARAAELGFDNPFGIWVNGRAGAMGEVGADVAAAAIGFMAPHLSTKLWEGRPAGLSANGAAMAYAEAAASWGRDTLAGMAEPDLRRLSELADRVAMSADPSIGALFAAWRAIDRPDDPAGEATIVLNVLRELRGGAHLAASHATGLGPHGAIISAPDPIRGGPAGAERFGWPEPHPTPDPAGRVEAERLTTVICAPAFASLSEAEGQELTELVLAARAAMD